MYNHYNCLHVGCVLVDGVGVFNVYTQPTPATLSVLVHSQLCWS